MLKGSGMKKGSAFERQICKQLSFWWSNNEDPNIFWRSQGSGGRATRVKSVQQYGDVAAVDPSGKRLLETVSIELKKGYGVWSPFDAVDGPSRVLDAFLEQVKRDQKLAKVPYFWLIFQRNRRQVCLLTSLMFFKAYYWDEFYYEIKECGRLNHNKSNYAIVQLNKFLKTCKPEKLK
jgi:hypothetical protein